MVMPQHNLGGEAILRIVAETRPTLSCGVPTIWNDVLRAAEQSEADLSSLRAVTAGGSAVPRALIEAFDERFGVPLVQGWGMTETSPLATFGIPPTGFTPTEEMDYRVKAGRIVPGVHLRVVAEDGSVLPSDGRSVGEIEVRGPWVTGSYYRDEDPTKFHDGWLRTGDVGAIDELGYLTISDRTKDVIKSGGEWISSVDLEGEVMAHPAVFEAAVIAVPDPKWDERPLACVVLRPDATASAEELVEHLRSRVVKWWLPERWAFIDAVPKTSVGKFDKKVLRSEYEKGALTVVEVDLHHSR